MSGNGSNGSGNGALPMLTKQDFQSGQETRWCPGCGDYAILASVQALMPELGIPPERTVFISGIGCSGRFVYYMDTYGMHGIHGRALPLATGIGWIVTARFVDRIGKLLVELDVQPKQVMIEAKILEVTLDESENFGVDWKKIFGSAGNTSGSFGTSGLASGSADKPSQGFFFSLLDRNLTAYLSALAARGRVRTLATPKLLAMENQESKAVIGDSTGYKVTTTINLVTTETVQFLESGVILKVTPSVDQQGRVLLKVHPEVSSASLIEGIPSKKSTEVTTELICEDGQSIFIGGLIKGKSSLERQGVPILGDLPVVGGLFSNRNESVSSSETVVIITPYVVREPKDADKLSEDKVRQAERITGAIREDQVKLLRGRASEFEAP